MKIREKPKKSISEFYSAREDAGKAITLITNGYKFSHQQESQKIKYFSNTMKRTTELEFKTSDCDKYRMLAGKLHVYKSESESYLPILNNNFIDIFRVSRRIKYDSNLTKRSSRISSPVLIDPGLSSAAKDSDVKFLKSSQSARTVLLGKNNLSATGQSWQQNTARDIRTSYKLNR